MCKRPMFVTLVALVALSGCSLPHPIALPPSDVVLADERSVPLSVRQDVHSGLQEHLSAYNEDRSGDLTVTELPVLMTDLDMGLCCEDGALLRWLDTNGDGFLSTWERLRIGEQPFEFSQIPMRCMQPNCP